MKLRNMSATTWKHVHAFINDFCDFVPDMSAADIRATAKGADDDSPYWFAAGIVEGSRPNTAIARVASISRVSGCAGLLNGLSATNCVGFVDRLASGF